MIGIISKLSKNIEIIHIDEYRDTVKFIERTCDEVRSTTVRSLPKLKKTLKEEYAIIYDPTTTEARLDALEKKI